MIKIEESGAKVGAGQPVYVVAEVSCNHRGSLHLARELVKAAAWAGANAVKFQAYTPDELTCNSSRPAYMMKEGPWRGRYLWDLYQEARTPLEWLPELFALARVQGLVPFASVFGLESLSTVAALQPSLYKVASAEVADLGFVELVASEGLPVVLSDGMATTMQIARALTTLQEQAVLLHCVSTYPADLGQYSLPFIQQMAQSQVPVGLSDHTVGTLMAPAAVAAGACMVEKHIVLPRWRYWPGARPLDWDHSIRSAGFLDMVGKVRLVEYSRQLPPQLGRPEGTAKAWRRRLVFAYDMDPGVKITADLLRTARAGMGWEPDRLEAVVGRKLTVQVQAGDPVIKEAFQ